MSDLVGNQNVGFLMTRLIWLKELAYGMLNLQSYKSEVRLKGRKYKKQAFINVHFPVSFGCIANCFKEKICLFSTHLVSNKKNSMLIDFQQT